MEVPSNEKVAALLAALPAHAMRGRGSESFRVGQQESPACRFFCWLIREAENLRGSAKRAKREICFGDASCPRYARARF